MRPRRRGYLFVDTLTFISLVIGFVFVIGALSFSQSLREGALSSLPPGILDIGESHDGRALGGVNVLDLGDFGKTAKTLDNIAAYTNVTPDVDAWFLGGQPARKVTPAYVSTDFFSVLGVRPLLGGSFSDAYSRELAISGRLWRQHFHSNPAIVGTAILLNGDPFRVVAVIDDSFDLPTGTDLWMAAPLLQGEFTPFRRNYAFHGLAKLKPGFTLAHARTELEGFSNVLQQRYPTSNVGISFTARPLLEALLDRLNSVLNLVMALGIGLFLVVWGNYLTVRLIRGFSKRGEFAMRAVIGASPGRLFFEEGSRVFAEAALAVICGCALGMRVLTLVPRLFGPMLPLHVSLTMSWKAAAILGSLTCASAVGVALYVTTRERGNLVSNLRAYGDRSTSLGRNMTVALKVLMGAQIGLATVVVMCSLLFYKELKTLELWQFGIAASKLSVMDVVFPRGRIYVNSEVETLLTNSLDSIRSVPGVEDVAASTEGPFESQYNYNVQIPQSAETIVVAVKGVTPGYFQTLGIPIIAGGSFSAESSGSALRCIIDEDLARAYWPGKNAVNHVVKIEGAQLLVVGVVGSTNYFGLHRPTLYLPIENTFSDKMAMVSLHAYIRHAADLSSDSPANRVHAVYPPSLVTALTRVDKQLSAVQQPVRSGAMLAWPIALCAILLASIGTLVIVTYVVAKRSTEIAIRIVFGATIRDVRLTTLRFLIVPLLGGVAAGMLLVRSSSQLLLRIMHHTQVLDSEAAVLTVSLIALLSLLAAWLPLQRVKHVNPVRELNTL